MNRRPDANAMRDMALDLPDDVKVADHLDRHHAGLYFLCLGVGSRIGLLPVASGAKWI